eukprot:gene7407-8661_t
MYEERTGLPRETKPGKSWWKSFKDEFQIKLVTPKSMDKTRVEKFITSVRKEIVDHEVALKNIINYDEKGISFTSNGQKVATMSYGHDEAKARYRPHQGKLKQPQHYTVIATIMADGSSLPFYHVIQYPKKVQEKYTANNENEQFELSPSGFVNAGIKLNYVKWLVDNFKEKDKKILICDNHGSNFFSEFVETLDKHNFTLITVPSGSTHVSQPLDLVAFSSFSAAVKRRLPEFIRRLETTKFSGEHFMKVSSLAWSESATIKNIRESWSKSRIIKYGDTMVDPVDHELLAAIAAKKKNRNKKALVTAPSSTQPITLADKKKTGMIVTSKEMRYA